MKPPTISRPLLVAAGSFTLLAAVGHLMAAIDHAPQGPLHVFVFGAAALAQAAVAAIMITRPGPQTAALTAGLNLAFIATWTASRTIGFPLIDQGVEPVGSLDAFVVALEVTAIASLSAAVYRRRISSLRGILAPGLAMILVLAVAAGPGMTAGGGHGHDTSLERGADTAVVSHHDEGDLIADGIHLHGLGGVDRDPGVDPGRTDGTPLDATTFDVGRTPAAVLATRSAIWVANRTDGTLTRLDPRTRELTSVPIGGSPAALASTPGSLWVADFTRDLVLRIDPSTGRSLGRVDVGPGPAALTTADGAVWVASVQEGTVQRIDPSTMNASAPLPVGYGPVALASTPGTVWVVNALDHTVVPVDTRARRAGTPIEVPPGAVDVLHAHGRLWVASASSGTVTVIDPVTRLLDGDPITVDTRTDAGEGPTGLAYLGDSIFVANNHDKTVLAIDAVTRRLGSPLFFSNQLGSGPIAVRATASREGLWVTDFDASTLAHIDIRRMS